MAEAHNARVMPVDLHALDTLVADSIALFVFRDQAPPGGVAGLVDWRLGGALAQAQARGHFQGLVGEHLLMPAPVRLHHLHVFVFGLGLTTEADDAAFAAALNQAQQVVSQAGCRRLAVAVPHLDPPHPHCDPTAVFLTEAQATTAHIIAKVLSLRVD